MVNVMGFKMPHYQSPTLLLSLGLSVRVLWQLLRHRPDVIHVSSPGMLVFAAILYSKLLAIPLVCPAAACPLRVEEPCYGARSKSGNVRRCFCRKATEQARWN